MLIKKLSIKTHLVKYKVIYSILFSCIVHLIALFLLFGLPEPQPEFVELEFNLTPTVQVAPEQKTVKAETVQNKTIQATDKSLEEQEEEIEETPQYQPFYNVGKRPSFLTKAELRYPLIERQRGNEGVVVVEADIDKSGTLRDVRIVKSAGQAFDEAALAMVQNSTFAPGINAEGKKIAVRMRFTVRFNLED